MVKRCKFKIRKLIVSILTFHLFLFPLRQDKKILSKNRNYTYNKITGRHNNVARNTEDVVSVNLEEFPKILKNKLPREKKQHKFTPFLSWHQTNVSLQLQHKKLCSPKGNLIPTFTVQRDPVLPVEKKQLHWISANIVY